MSRKRSAAGSSYDVFDYWLMPQGLRGLMTTVFWPGARIRNLQRPTTVRARNNLRSPYPAPLRPFPMLAPGKMARDLGEHTFWRGSLWGRTVALQGDSSFAKYDLFEIAGSQLHYWGTFRGNGYYDSEESHSFSTPYVWMDQAMKVGDFKQQRITDTVFDPRLRRAANSAEQSLRVELVAHYDTWKDPDSQVVYEDVLEVHYWGRHPEPVSREVYHLGRGLGTIRFETFNGHEPSGVRYQYAEYFERFTPPDLPTIPWIDPFHNATHVRNGFCEDFLVAPVEGGTVASHLRGWSGSQGGVITRDQGDDGTGPWKIALRGALSSDTADFAATDWVPVIPGRRYRLSGRIWRTSRADVAYLDYNDGSGQGGNFDDAHATASAVGMWERVAAETTVGPATTALKVRCVREGTRDGAAYFDAITLQRIG